MYIGYITIPMERYNKLIEKEKTVDEMTEPTEEEEEVNVPLVLYVDPKKRRKRIWIR